MIPPTIGIGPLGAGEWSVPGVGSLQAPVDAGNILTGSQGGFSDVLSNAISALDNSQATATQTAQQLATGQLSDPTKAVTAVENAQLMMDFASTMRNQIDTAATTLFQTQV